MTRDEIKAMAAEYGFTLNQDFCDFAERLLKTQLEQMLTEGWRQCAKGQHTSQFCGQLEDAVLAEREACAKVAESWNTAIGDIFAAEIRARGNYGKKND